MRTNHINYPNLAGEIYCRKLKTITTLGNVTSNFCKNCTMYSGSAQGEGVECSWTDTRKNLEQPYVVTDPSVELLQLQAHDYFNLPPILRVED